MSNKIALVLATASAAFALVGCGAPAPVHVEKPLTARPPATDFKSLKTPEEKIKFIQDSRAPESEKQKAIEQVKAGTI